MWKSQLIGNDFSINTCSWAQCEPKLPLFRLILPDPAFRLMTPHVPNPLGHPRHIFRARQIFLNVTVAIPALNTQSVCRKTLRRDPISTQLAALWVGLRSKSPVECTISVINSSYNMPLVSCLVYCGEENRVCTEYIILWKLLKEISYGGAHK